MSEANGKAYEYLLMHMRGAKSHGDYFSALCPLHDDSKPSLLVYIDGFYCLGCRRKGSLAQLYRLVTKPSSSKRQQYDNLPLASPTHYPYELPSATLARLAHSTLMTFPDQKEYLIKRRIEDRIEPNELGWYDGYYTFPVLTRDGEYSSVILRAGPEVEKRTRNRFLTAPHQSPCMYVPDWGLITRSPKIYVVFGLIDSLALTALRIPAVTSTHGTRFESEWLDEYRKPIIVIPDDNEDEKRLAANLATRLGWRGSVLELRYAPHTKDPSDMIMAGQTLPLLAQL